MSVRLSDILEFKLAHLKLEVFLESGKIINYSTRPYRTDSHDLPHYGEPTVMLVHLDTERNGVKYELTKAIARVIIENSHNPEELLGIECRAWTNELLGALPK